MKIKNLIQQHQSSRAKHQLDRNLGDGYLLEKNEIYHSVRQKSLEIGFTYSDQYDETYAALPLSQLDRVLKSKVIPYQNNVSVLKEIEAKVPDQIEWDHICDNLKQNHVFHESCHAVARNFSNQFKLHEQFKEIKQNKLALILLEESFANTCELLAVIFVNDATHRIFFEINSYICMFDDKTYLKKAMSHFDKSNFFQFILLAYFHANFLHDKMSEQEFKRILNLSFGINFKPDAQEGKVLKSLAKNAFALNPRFRSTTTSFYMRMNGIPQDAKQALAFDHLKILEESPELQKLLVELADFQDQA